MNLLRRFRASSMAFFRLAKTPLLVGAILGFAVGMVIVINNTNKALEESRIESDRHQAQMQEIVEEIQTRTKAIDDHLDCILEYFGTERRGGLFIEDIGRCRLKRSKTPVSQSEPSKQVAVASVPNSQPRGQDRSFLDCLPAEARKDLNKLLPKKHVLRTMKCQR